MTMAFMMGSPATLFREENQHLQSEAIGRRRQVSARSECWVRPRSDDAAIPARRVQSSVERESPTPESILHP